MRARGARRRQGGLLPHARTASPRSRTARARRPRAALEGADGTAYTWAEHHGARAFGAPCARRARRRRRRARVQLPGVVLLGARRDGRGLDVSGIYTTNTYAQAAHILRTSAVRVLVLESREQPRRRTPRARDFPAVAPRPAGGDDDPRSSTPSFAAFCARAAAGRRRAAARPRSSTRARSRRSCTRRARRATPRRSSSRTRASPRSSR